MKTKTEIRIQVRSAYLAKSFKYASFSFQQLLMAMNIKLSSLFSDKSLI